MNRRKFVLSWGRKLFFGISWPLSILLALISLRSFILPGTTGEWFYFTVNLLGHLGLMNALVYFLLYCPLVLLMPSYYFSRFWSLILISLLNMFILLDAVSFAQYQMHLYSFLGIIFMEEGVEHLLTSQLTVILVAVSSFIVAIFIWIRGETFWRAMQGRFSNPVKNWYLLVILLLVMLSKAFFYFGNIRPELTTLLPLDFYMTKELSDTDDGRKFYYPSSLSCQGKQNPNLVVIALKEWSTAQFNEESMPHVFHMKDHAISYNNHQDVAFNGQGGLFSLFYSVPAIYESSVLNMKPFFLHEMNKRNYEVLDLGRHNPEAFNQFISWSQERTSAQPYFVSMVLNLNASDADRVIQDVILILLKQNFLSNTHIVITGGFSGNTQSNIPLLHVTPKRAKGDFNHPTSHYDLMPSLIDSMWNCKNAFSLTGLGYPLSQPDRNWLLISEKDHFKILDFKNDSKIEVLNNSLKKEGNPRIELIFPAIKMLNRFKI